MADRRYTDAELDALIEAALGDEPLAPVPRSFHSCVVERVRLVALEQQERARFRNALLSGFTACVGVVAAAVAVLALTNFHILLDHGVSGGLGFWDYYRATFEVAWPVRVDGVVLALSVVLGAGTIWVGLLPLRRPGLFPLLGATRGQGALDDRLLRTR